MINDFNDRLVKLWSQFDEDVRGNKSPLLYKNFETDSILFIGLNPSFSHDGIKSFLKDTDTDYNNWSLEDIEDRHKFKNIGNYRDAIIEIHSIAIEKYFYFKPLKEISEYAGMKNKWNHLDLFYQRVTDQKEFKKSIIKNNQLSDFAAAQLKITCDIIDYIKPRIIIVVNALARDIIRQHSIDMKFGKFNDEHCFYPLTIKNKKYITLLSGMLTGQRAIDTGSLERLKWHVKYILNKMDSNNIKV